MNWNNVLIVVVSIMGIFSIGLTAALWYSLFTKVLPRKKSALMCPACGFEVEEVNRNNFYIAAQCDWCNEVVHIEIEE